METIRHDMPRANDGSVDVLGLTRQLVETALNEIMDVQADECCAEGGNTRNGYRTRRLVTTVGTLTLNIPKLRTGTYFPSDVIERYSRTDKAVVAAVSEMYANGVSTRKVERVAHALGVDRMSSQQVGRICAALDDEVAQLRSREFADMRFPYLWLDATYVKCRREGRVASTAVVTAIAVGEDGVRRFVGMDAVDTESYDSWSDFLSDLRRRGVDGVSCVVSDAHEGLRRAISETFVGAAWQRCIVHLERDVCRLLKTKRQRAMAARVMQAVFREEEPVAVRAAYHAAADAIEKLSPKAAGLLEEAECDALAYLDFPAEHRRRLRTNNVQERANREIKRRSRVVQVFPSTASMIRLVGAVCAEIDEDWSSRRYMAGDAISGFYEEQEVARREALAAKGSGRPSAAAVERASKIIELAIETVGSKAA